MCRGSFTLFSVNPIQTYPPLLQISDVRQAFRSGFFLKQTEILHGVSFEIPARSIFGFLGPNGAGKTTLIHLITGIRRPKSGSIRLNGVDTQEPRARAKIGYLPERPYFHEHLSGEAFLHYFGALSGMSHQEVDDKIPGVLDAVSMAHARKLELKSYSKGMLQRIGIAQAILHDPELLVLDEPMSGLDPVGRKEIRELILRLASEGRTIFFSSHVIPDVEAICDQVAVIEKGTLRGCGPISGFLDRDGAQKIEIAVAGASEFSSIFRESPQQLGVASFRAIPEGLRITLEGRDRLHSLLSQVLAKPELQLLWVNPIRPSLEDLFERRTAGVSEGVAS
jgi:ABC-2 type transport system ATP-binding protein